MTVAGQTGRTGPTAQPGHPVRHRSVGRGERAWLIAAILAGVVLVGFIAYVVTRPHGQRPVAYPVAPPAQLGVGTEAPSFTLPRLGGGPAVGLASTRGVPTVVNFFASWCKDCQAELAAFGSLAAQTTGAVAIVGVDSNDSDPRRATALLAHAHAGYPVGVDAQAKVATSYLLTALPVTYFLDARGQVVHAAFGAQSLAALDHWVAVLTGRPVHR
jgi:peroxiredoxin